MIFVEAELSHRESVDLNQVLWNNTPKLHIKLVQYESTTSFNG